MKKYKVVGQKLIVCLCMVAILTTGCKLSVMR